eukprot:scaffold317_cov379-Prasinococcus_capsulatus_cf.AAC.7
MAPLVGFHVQEFLALVSNTAPGHLVGWVASQHLRKGALSTSVLAHDSVYFSLLDRQVDALENLLVDRLHLRF